MDREGHATAGADAVAGNRAQRPPHHPEPESLRTQLAELNTRSRTYTAQIWQIPFAYIGIVGVILVQLIDESAHVTRVALVAVAIFGLLVLIHFTSMVNGVRRAVLNIQATERSLKLDETAQYRPVWYIWPLGALVVLTIIAAAVGAFYAGSTAFGVSEPASSSFQRMGIARSWVGSLVMELDPLNLAIAVAALLLSVIALQQSRRVRRSDSFAQLYDEINSAALGADLERVGEWSRTVASRLCLSEARLTEAHIRLAYREYYGRLLNGGANTKDDPIEAARRKLKAWFIKCLLYHEARDISTAHLQALITRDRAAIMLRVFDMTREQTDVWKRLDHDAKSRHSSDEMYFGRLERVAERQGVTRPVAD